MVNHQIIAHLVFCYAVFFAAVWGYRDFLAANHVFVFMELATQPFVMEEMGQLNSFYLAMPVKRSDIVKGRYAFAIFVLAFSLLVGSALVLLWDGFFAGLLPFIPRIPITFSGFVTMLSLSYFLVQYTY